MQVGKELDAALDEYIARFAAEEKQERTADSAGDLASKFDREMLRVDEMLRTAGLVVASDAEHGNSQSPDSQSRQTSRRECEELYRSFALGLPDPTTEAGPKRTPSNSRVRNADPLATVDALLADFERGLPTNKRTTPAGPLVPAARARARGRDSAPMRTRAPAAVVTVVDTSPRQSLEPRSLHVRSLISPPRSGRKKTGGKRLTRTMDALLSPQRRDPATARAMTSPTPSARSASKLKSRTLQRLSSPRRAKMETVDADHSNFWHGSLRPDRTTSGASPSGDSGTASIGKPVWTGGGTMRRKTRTARRLGWDEHVQAPPTTTQKKIRNELATSSRARRATKFGMDPAAVNKDIVNRLHATHQAREVRLERQRLDKERAVKDAEQAECRQFTTASRARQARLRSPTRTRASSPTSESPDTRLEPSKPRRKTKRSQKKMFDRLHESNVERDARVSRMKRHKEKQLAAQATFKPSISDRARKVARAGDFERRLHTSNLGKVRVSVPNECSFTPELSKKTRNIVASRLEEGPEDAASRLHRSSEEAKRKHEQLLERKRRLEEEREGATFTPEILSKSRDCSGDAPSHERLYRAAQNQQKQRHEQREAAHRTEKQLKKIVWCSKAFVGNNSALPDVPQAPKSPAQTVEDETGVEEAAREQAARLEQMAAARAKRVRTAKKAKARADAEQRRAKEEAQRQVQQKEEQRKVQETQRKAQEAQRKSHERQKKAKVSKVSTAKGGAAAAKAARSGKIWNGKSDDQGKVVWTGNRVKEETSVRDAILCSVGKLVSHLFCFARVRVQVLFAVSRWAISFVAVWQVSKEPSDKADIDEALQSTLQSRQELRDRLDSRINAACIVQEQWIQQTSRHVIAIE